MKQLLKSGGLIVLILSFNFAYSCKKEKPVQPSITTSLITEISYTTAVSGGNVTDEGTSPLLSMGICWSIAPDASLDDNKTSQNGALGSFVSNISQLSPNTKYYVRAYATSSAGTGYGSEISFTTSAVAAPLLTTAAITDITGSSAVSGGSITTENGSSVTGRGVCWSTTSNPTISDPKTTDGIGIGSYISSLTGLTEGTLYHIRSYATNDAGTNYGQDLTFITLAKPSLITSEVSNITLSTAISGGNISSDGGSPILEKGVCWNSVPNPTISDNKAINGSGVGTYSINMNGLSPNSTYYLRAYATNALGTSYGNELNLKTFAVIDADGNGYYSVNLGTQTWMTENLRTTKFNNGDPIGTTTSNITNEIAPIYQWNYDKDPSLTTIYGRYYTWYAAIDDRKICPTGWHLPTINEFGNMAVYLGNQGFGFEGNNNYIAKSLASTSGWRESSNPGAPGYDQKTNNRSGFTATPGGSYHSDNSYGSETMMSAFWTSLSKDDQYGFTQQIGNNYLYLFLSIANKKDGIPIRCVKD